MGVISSSVYFVLLPNKIIMVSIGPDFLAFSRGDLLSYNEEMESRSKLIVESGKRDGGDAVHGGEKEPLVLPGFYFFRKVHARISLDRSAHGLGIAAN